jgi:hypothetical protein
MTDIRMLEPMSPFIEEVRRTHLPVIVFAGFRLNGYLVVGSYSGSDSYLLVEI